MKRENIYVGETKLPDSLQVNIIARFMKNSELKQFWDSYVQARTTDKTVRAPTEIQYKYAKLRKRMTTKEVAVQENVEVFKVIKAIQKVAIWEYLNS